MKNKIRVLPVILLLAVVFPAEAQLPQNKVLSFSAVQGSPVKPYTLTLPAKIKAATVKILGADKDNFTLTPLKSPGTAAEKLVITFTPKPGAAGISRARLLITGRAPVDLTGLATNGLEEIFEPALSDITAALGYKINPGWTAPANHIKPALQGEEIAAALFLKAGAGKVQMIPVARYSPDFDLPFGYYTNTAHAPDNHQSGIISKSGTYIQHQALNPDVSVGGTSFDPGSSTFGFYVTGPTHTSYSEDVWNMALFPANTSHATRIYAAKDKEGKLMPNTYLVCFEEAETGAYNDCIFLVKNVKPLTKELFTTVFNGKDLTGFHTYLQKYGTNKDPDKNFRVEDGALHVIGKDLGYAITDKSFTDFHLKVDFKWGEARWPPRQNNKRDGGVLYNISAAEPDSIWPASIECQIQEGDVGDFWMLGFSTLRVNGKVNRPTNHVGVAKKKDNERPYGEWNTIEVISYKGKCVQVVNGLVVNYGDNASVKSGRFILQSEYAEIYYKNVKIREL